MTKELSPSVLNKLFVELQNVNCQFKVFKTSNDMWDYPMKLIKKIEEQIDGNKDIVFDIIAEGK